MASCCKPKAADSLPWRDLAREDIYRVEPWDLIQLDMKQRAGKIHCPFVSSTSSQTAGD